MYDLNVNLPIDREPWMIPLFERKKILYDSYRNGKKIAVMVYNRPDTSTFRYRCYNVYKASLKSEKWQAVYFYNSELDTLLSVLPLASLVVFTRLKWTYPIENIINELHRAKIPILFDIDDYICDIDALKIVTNTLNVHFGSEVDYDFWFADFSRLQKTASLADGFITTNAYLGTKLSTKFDRPYRLIINSLNDEQMAVSASCLEEKKKSRSDGRFVIGYFSGTPSHINDFKVVAPEIMSFLNDNPDAVLKVTGFMEFPEYMREMIAAKRVLFEPLVDFLELQVRMAQVDVSIVPLVNNSFTNCKSELKYFEAAVVDTPTIATPTYTYSHAIRNGENGFLCDQGEWYVALEALHEHPDRIPPIVEKAKDRATAEYYGEQFLTMIEDSYGFFCP